MALKIVRTGTWRYDHSVEMPVDVVGIDRDWWFSLTEADGMLQEGELPMPLGDEGLLYYARFRRAGEREEPTWVDTEGFRTPVEAMAAAEQKAPSVVTWQSSPEPER